MVQTVAVPIFSLSVCVYSETRTHAEITTWAGVEPKRGRSIGDPVDPLDPEGPKAKLTAWVFKPAEVAETESVEPWMEGVRPLLKHMSEHPFEGTTRRVFVGLSNDGGGGLAAFSAADLVLIAAAGCRLDIDSYDSPTDEGAFQRAKGWVLAHTGHYERGAARRELARTKAREARIAARSA